METTLNHPVDEVSQLDHRKHLNVHCRQRNLADDESLGDNVVSADKGCFVTEFAAAILQCSEQALQAESVAYSDLSSPKKYVRALLLRDAHALESRGDIVDALKDDPAIAATVGFPSKGDITKANTFGGHARQAESEDALKKVPQGRLTERELITNAARRAVWAAVRAGIPLPAATVEKYDIDLSLAIDERTVPLKTKRIALRNWVATLFGATLPELSLWRADNKSHLMPAIVGLLAHSALQEYGTDAAWSSIPAGLSWDVPHDINQQIRNLNPRKVAFTLSQANRRFFEVATDRDLLSSPQTLAFDPTTVLSHAEDADGTIGRHNETGQVWFFPCVAAVGDSRYVLGTHLISDKGNAANRLGRTLNTQRGVLEVGPVMADREYHDEVAIRTSKKVADEWIIRCKPTILSPDYQPDEKESPDEPGQSHWKHNITVGDETVNAVWYHPPDNSQSNICSYLTGLSQSDTSAQTVHERYQTRTEIEPTFDDLKNNFHPLTKSSSRPLRDFYFGISMLCFNIYALANNNCSPELGLRLDVTPQDVLTAIRHVCLSSELPDRVATQ